MLSSTDLLSQIIKLGLGKPLIKGNLKTTIHTSLRSFE